MRGWVENVKIIQNKPANSEIPPLLSSLQASQNDIINPPKGVLISEVQQQKTPLPPTHTSFISRGWHSSSSPYLFAEPQESNRIGLSPQAASPVYTAGPERANTRWQGSEARFGLECKIPALFVYLSVAQLQDWCFLQPWLQLQPYPLSEGLKQHPDSTLQSFSFFFFLTVAWGEIQILKEAHTTNWRQKRFKGREGNKKRNKGVGRCPEKLRISPACLRRCDQPDLSQSRMLVNHHHPCCLISADICHLTQFFRAGTEAW